MFDSSYKELIEANRTYNKLKNDELYSGISKQGSPNWEG